ncbi:hypothetical protein [Microbacterium sp. 1.5R]|uniref:hypothetical protein n=1 Tax=Microbacterium sp. 1.5R TaxID=1916917 RepID=UPI00164369A8|nr:hypothetical protein [Microbacterium sp. 1.5R]
MLRRPIDLRVDRDSVAMGDDVVSHAGVISVPRGTLLSAAIERSSPEIRSPGWSWIAVVDVDTAAVWSVDHGVRLLVADRPLRRGPVEIFFRYFVQIDPAWLFDRLARGDKPDRRALEEQYAPIAREKHRAELRRRERELDGRLLSAPCVDALRHLGAEVTLHADVACEFTFQGEAWVVRRADTMLQVFRGAGGPIASIRPHALGEAWIVGVLAVAARTAAGTAARLDALPDAELSPGLELTASGGRWMSHGATVVQVHSEIAARVAQLAHGRSVVQMRALFDA